MNRLRYSQEVREQILADREIVEALKHCKEHSYSWTGTSNHIYQLGRLKSGLYIALRSPFANLVGWQDVKNLEEACESAENINNGKIRESEDYVKQFRSVDEAVTWSKKTEKPITITTSFCIGVRYIQFGAERFELLVEDLSAGNKYQFESSEDIDVRTMKGTLVKVVFDIGDYDLSSKLEARSEMKSLRYFHPKRIVDLEKL